MTDPTLASEASLSIDSIKEIMDGIDPEALLPEMSSIFQNILLICRIVVMIGPVLLLLLGLTYLLLAPKEANYYIGYRCYFGMGSIQAWQFTQRLAGIVMGSLGLILTIVMAILSMGFSKMAMMDMVWKAVRCLIWEAVLALLATLCINGVVAFWFNRKGEVRVKNPQPQKDRKPGKPPVKKAK